MHQENCFKFVLCLLVSIAGTFRLGAQSGVLTVQVGAAPLPPAPLVNHGDLWRYRLGTNAPPPGWQTNADATLDASWLSGPGGFGFEDGDDATDLTVMSNLCTTVYIRKSFVITEAVDPARHLTLVMDYDDGFVAWLDGVQVARSPNAPGAAGTEPAYNAVTLAGQNHEALGYQGKPLEVYDLGLVGTRLQPGTHVLALMGLNAGLTSSDLSLIPDLQLTGGQNAPTEGAFFALVHTNLVSLSGSNTVAGTTRVTVNGLDAAFNPAAGTWSREHPLTPGMNHLFIAAVDAGGAIVASTNKDVILETATTSVGGMLAGNATWTRAMGTIRVTNTLTVPTGVTLSIDAGVVVLLSPNASIRAQANGGVAVSGTDDDPAYFLPADGTTAWRELSALGTNSFLNLRQAEVVAGQIIAYTNSVVTIEDSVLRDFPSGSRYFLTSSNAQQVLLRRCVVTRYAQIRFARSPVTIEDCLLEHITSDASDFDGHPDIHVRRTTYRYAEGSNTDALDLGGNPGMTIENCLIHDMPDKAVSIAGFSHGTIVSNCLFYRCGIGISAYSASNCVYVNTTIADCTTGILHRERNGGEGAGHAVATNLIVWDNTSNIFLTNSGTLQASYSDIQDTNVYAGAGNLNADPLFADPARGDYRLRAGSPAIGAGQDGVNLGPVFPVGGIPPAPFALTASPVGTNEIRLSWREDADNEAGFLVERSTNGGPWQGIGATAANVTNFSDFAVALDELYAYRVRATNHAGNSRFSNLAAAAVHPPTTIVGGTLAGNTTWSGIILAFTNVTVPTNVTLSVLPGTVVKLSNDVSLRAVAGGRIEIAGAPDSEVTLLPMNGTNVWGELAATGTNAALTIRHADISGGSVKFYSQAVGLVEDSHIHNYYSGTAAIMGSTSARSVTLRRCHIAWYHETLFQFTLMLIEDCLFEHATNPSSDGMDFDAAPAGSIVRRCTFRHGPQNNTDAIDIGSGGGRGSTDVLIEDCLMFDYSDKGVSIGEDSFGIVVRNCLIYGVGKGIQVKDVCTATIGGNTIVDCGIGLHGYEKIANTGGGQMTNTFNNILWGNTSAIVLETNSLIVVNYSDVPGTNWPGTGNLSTDPLFLNPAARDYRLAANSPCVGTGQDGANMGAHFPVGAPMALSHPRIESLAVHGSAVTLRFWADSEKSYRLEAGDDLAANSWTSLTNVPTRPLPALVEVTEGLSTRQRFYRLVTPEQP